VKTPDLTATRATNAVIATVFAHLINREGIGDTLEAQLVVEALRRSTSGLAEASHEALGDYLRELSIEQLRGVASNVKGIYHELHFVHAENVDGDSVSAELFGATNHPGADVQLMLDDEVVAQLQLKATDSTAHLAEHATRYPGIELFATSEIARATGVRDSGFSNHELGGGVEGTFGALQGADVLDRACDAGNAAALLSALAHTHAIATGKIRAGEAVKGMAHDLGVAVTSTALVDLLFS